MYHGKLNLISKLSNKVIGNMIRVIYTILKRKESLNKHFVFAK